MFFEPSSNFLTSDKKFSRSDKDIWTNDKFPFSSPDEFDVPCSVSFALGDKLIECISVVHEVGEEHALHGSESADPNVSEAKADKTEVGDWFSFSDTDELGDGDLSS